MPKNACDQATIDELVREKLEEYRQAHIPKIEMKFGHTYISFGRRDCITEEGMYYLKKLFYLMDVDYSMNIPMYDEEFFIVINGEDANRTAFIQKFIDNGYKLSWK